METRFLKPVSTNDSQITLRAHITEQKRNIIIIDATLENSAGEICSQSRSTYFAFPQEKAKQEMFFSGCLTEGE
jgi:acyl-coenzyme A thioesterase PaaI-like protein